MTSQPELPLSTSVAAPIGAAEVDWFVEELRGRDWGTAEELLTSWGHPVTEQAKRRLRALAEASGGRIAGGQRGYKLVKDMTGEEYQRCRNAMLSQVKNMQRRVVEMDNVFFPRKPVQVAV